MGKRKDQRLSWLDPPEGIRTAFHRKNSQNRYRSRQSLSFGDSCIGFDYFSDGTPFGYPPADPTNSNAGLFVSPSRLGSFLSTGVNPPGHTLSLAEVAMFKRHDTYWN